MTDRGRDDMPLEQIRWPIDRLAGQRHHTLLLCCALAIQLFGCTKSSSESTRGAIRPIATGARDPVAAGPLHQEHDLGLILADAQTLRHEFTLQNPTDQPVHCNAQHGAHSLLLGN